MVNKAKFYVMWDLPCNFLIVRSLIHALGWKLTHTTKSYHHKAENIEDVEEESDGITCSAYPLIEDQKVDVNKVECGANPELREWIVKQLEKYNEIVAKNEMDSGQIPNVEFRVDFKDDIDVTPLAYREYPHSIAHVEEIERQLTELIKRGFISPSISHWRAPTFIVPKKTGDARIVFDFRGINSLTKTMQYGLPNPTTLMHKFKGKAIMSSIDIKSGYWHIPVYKPHRERLAFVFNNKLYEWNVMPFGPKNAPAYFQKTMNDIFSRLDFVIVYMDDVTIVSNSVEEHKEHLRKVFEVIAKIILN